MKVYFDTEFCSLWDPTPISFGFVAETGEEFYVEVIHEEERRSDFVNKTIVPLLDNLMVNAFRASRDISGWFETLQHTNRDIDLVCDFIGDYWILSEFMLHVLDVTPRCAYGADTAPIFKAYPALRQHHALDDARALRLLNPELQVE